MKRTGERETRDIRKIVRGEIDQGWHATDKKYLLRVKDIQGEKCL